MSRGLIKFILAVGALYALLHLVLASSPVQRKVFEEVRAALLKFGLDLQIESIEFSAFSPKIYLNRVKLGVVDPKKIPLEEPLQVDKIKIQFQPLALLSKQIIIEETSLFHPRIYVPHADNLYKKLKKLFEEESKLSVQGSSFAVTFKKIGIVDALFNVQSQDPPFSIRSRSLSAFLEQNAARQQTVTLSSPNLEFDRGMLSLRLTKTDIDVDVSSNSLRLNKAIVEGENLSLNIKGATSIPKNKNGAIESFHSSYDVKFSLALLNQIPELKMPKTEGNLTAKGTIQLARGSYSGEGAVEYEAVSVDDYTVGSGKLDYALNDRRVSVRNVDLSYGGGHLVSPLVLIDLKEKFPLEGDFSMRGVHLEQILGGVGVPNAPVHLAMNGKLKAKGTLQNNFEINVGIVADGSQLEVGVHGNKPFVGENKVLAVEKLSVDGSLQFTLEKMGFKAKLNILEGTAETEGYVGFDSTAQLKVNGKALSLTKLHTISDIEFAGITDLDATVDVGKKGGNVGGSFNVRGGEIADVILGDVKGSAFYENDLLSFENLQVNSLEPIHGSGFVDFKPKKTRYKFNAQTRRASINQVFGMLSKLKLGFPIPQEGETGTRVTIEGGHDEEGIDITAMGQGKNFNWYGEKWLSASYSMHYRPKFMDLNRAMLVKRSGGVEARGHFEGKKSTLFLQSHGLRVEDLSWIGRAPLQGELVGSVRLEGDLEKPRGSGDVRLIKTYFRGVPLPESNVRLRSENGKAEFYGSVFGEKLKARLINADSKSGDDTSSLNVLFKNYDFGPLLAVGLGKEIPPLANLTATGELSIRGILGDWRHTSGSGTVTALEVGFRGTPMKSESPIQFRIDQGGIFLEKLKLTGSDSQVAIDYGYRPGQMVKASIDGKIDLQYLQPFIPGLEFGTGRVTTGVRVTGTPSNYTLLGNISLEDGTFRMTGLQDEFRNANVQLTLSQDRINVDKFEAGIGGGAVNVKGDVRVKKFQALIPNLSLTANRVTLKTGNYLTTRLTGELYIRGENTPYTLGGKCQLLEAKLLSFNVGEGLKTENQKPVFNFDIQCDAKDKLYVDTDVMKAEFKGNLKMTGNTNTIGLLGAVEAMNGQVIFKETKFKIETGGVKFEDAARIAPRFNVTSRAIVREERSSVPQDYDVGLQVFGTPADYKIRLNSTPALPEPDLISLLVLGVTTRGQDGNYLDFGSTIVGQTPFQSKLQSELGLDIRVSTQNSSGNLTSGVGGKAGGSGSAADTTVPAVKLQKEVSKNTKVSVSNTIDTIPLKEFKIEQMLNENFTINGARTEKNKGLTEPSAAYGVDVRYRFSFE